MVIYTIIVVAGYIFLFKYMSLDTKESEDELSDDKNKIDAREGNNTEGGD